MKVYKVSNHYSTESTLVSSRKKAIDEVIKMLGAEPDGIICCADEGSWFTYEGESDYKRIMQGYFGEEEHLFAIGAKAGYFNHPIHVTTIKIK